MTQAERGQSFDDYEVAPGLEQRWRASILSSLKLDREPQVGNAYLYSLSAEEQHTLLAPEIESFHELLNTVVTVISRNPNYSAIYQEARQNMPRYHHQKDVLARALYETTDLLLTSPILSPSQKASLIEGRILHDWKRPGTFLGKKAREQLYINPTYWLKCIAAQPKSEETMEAFVHHIIPPRDDSPSSTLHFFWNMLEQPSWKNTLTFLPSGVLRQMVFSAMRSKKSDDSAYPKQLALLIRTYEHFQAKYMDARGTDIETDLVDVMKIKSRNPLETKKRRTALVDSLFDTKEWPTLFLSSAGPRIHHRLVAEWSEYVQPDHALTIAEQPDMLASGTTRSMALALYFEKGITIISKPINEEIGAPLFGLSDKNVLMKILV